MVGWRRKRRRRRKRSGGDFDVCNNKERKVKKEKQKESAGEVRKERGDERNKEAHTMQLFDLERYPSVLC